MKSNNTTQPICDSWKAGLGIIRPEIWGAIVLFNGGVTTRGDSLIEYVAPTVKNMLFRKSEKKLGNAENAMSTCRECYEHIYFQLISGRKEYLYSNRRLQFQTQFKLAHKT